MLYILVGWVKVEGNEKRHTDGPTDRHGEKTALLASRQPTCG